MSSRSRKNRAARRHIDPVEQAAQRIASQMAADERHERQAERNSQPAVFNPDGSFDHLPEEHVIAFGFWIGYSGVGFDQEELSTMREQRFKRELRMARPGYREQVAASSFKKKIT